MDGESGCLRTVLRYTSIVGSVLGLIIDVVTIAEWLGFWSPLGNTRPSPPTVTPLPNLLFLAELNDITFALLMYVGFAFAVLSAWSPQPDTFVRTVAMRAHFWVLLLLAWTAAFIRSGSPYQYLHLIEGWIAGGLILGIWSFRHIDERKLLHIIAAWCLLGLSATILLAPAWGILVNKPLHGWPMFKAIEVAVVWSLLGTVFSVVLWLSCAIGVMMLRPVVRHMREARL